MTILYHYKPKYLTLRRYEGKLETPIRKLPSFWGNLKTQKTGLKQFLKDIKNFEYVLKYKGLAEYKSTYLLVPFFRKQVEILRHNIEKLLGKVKRRKALKF
jgi:hypothetical protein